MLHDEQVELELYRRQRRASFVRKLVVRSTLTVIWVVLWWLFAEWRESVVIPTPDAVWDSFVELNQTRTTSTGNVLRGYQGDFLWEHLIASLWRMARGVLLALVVGIVLGIVSGYFRVFTYITDPPINFIRQVPPLAYLPLMIGLYGLFDAAKVAILFLAAMPPIYIATVTGVRGVNRDAIDAAQSMGANKFQLLSTCIVPAALPEIMTGLRVAIGFAYTTVVAAELVNGLPGIGGIAFIARQQAQYAIVWVAIIVMGLTGIVLDAGIQALERRLVPWRGRV